MGNAVISDNVTIKQSGVISALGTGTSGTLFTNSSTVWAIVNISVYDNADSSSVTYAINVDGKRVARATTGAGATATILQVVVGTGQALSFTADIAGARVAATGVSFTNSP